MGKNISKAKIIHYAREKIQKQSYQTFSYAQIAKEFGISTASVHYYFQSKEDLGVAILQEYRNYIAKLISDLDEKVTNPYKKILAYFGYFKHIIKDGDKICTECILSAEYNTLPESMQNVLHELFNDHHSWLSQVLEEGRKKDLIKFEGSSKDKAILIKATMHGGITVARAFGKPEIFQVVLDQVKSLLGQSL